MLHDYLGAEVFMAGVQTYVEKKRDERTGYE